MGVAEKRWMIFVGLSRCGRWRWQPARNLVQGASNPSKGTDDARPPQSGLKPAAQIAKSALQQHLCSGHVAKGIPQPLAAPGKVMVHQQAAVVADEDQDGVTCSPPGLMWAAMSRWAGKLQIASRVLTAMTLAVQHRPMA